LPHGATFYSLHWLPIGTAKQEASEIWDACKYQMLVCTFPFRFVNCKRMDSACVCREYFSKFTIIGVILISFNLVWTHHKTFYMSLALHLCFSYWRILSIFYLTARNEQEMLYSNSYPSEIWNRYLSLAFTQHTMSPPPSKHSSHDTHGAQVSVKKIHGVVPTTWNHWVVFLHHLFIHLFTLHIPSIQQMVYTTFGYRICPYIHTHTHTHTRIKYTYEHNRLCLSINYNKSVIIRSKGMYSYSFWWLKYSCIV
jgi:hypothetical protein